MNDSSVIVSLLHSYFVGEGENVEKLKQFYPVIGEQQAGKEGVMEGRWSCRAGRAGERG